jgi:hypothetical protein
MRVVRVVGLGVLLCVGPSGAEEPSPPISPGSYRALTCPQIVQEARAVSRKGFVLSGLAPSTGGADNTDTKSAIIIVWPDSTSASADKMSRLRYAKSQIDALEQASIESQCSIEFQRPKIPDPVVR